MHSLWTLSHPTCLLYYTFLYVHLLPLFADRAFMDAVAPRLLVLKGDGLVRMFQGTYSEVGPLLSVPGRRADTNGPLLTVPAPFRSGLAWPGRIHTQLVPCFLLLPVPRPGHTRSV